MHDLLSAQKGRPVLHACLASASAKLRELARAGYKTFTGVPFPSGLDEDRCPWSKRDAVPSENLWFIRPQVRRPYHDAQGCVAQQFYARWMDESPPLRSVSPAFPTTPSVRGADALQGPSSCEQANMSVVLWRSERHVSGMVSASDAALFSSPLISIEMAKAFGSSLPEPMLSCIVAQLQKQPEPSAFGATIACSQLHTSAGAVVMLGDAGHTVTSSLGQGLNMALEGVRVLGLLLDASLLRDELALSEVPEAYTMRRRADVHALQQLELMSIIMRRGSAGLRLKGNPGEHVAHARVIMGSAMLIGLAQWKLVPGKYRTVPLYGMLYDPSVPYSDILAYARWTSATVCAMMGAAAVFTMLLVVQEM